MLTLTGFIAFVVWLFFLYQNFTKVVPEVGGEYTEGVVSEPRYINPLLAQTSQADADLVSVIYDGLFTRNGKGEIVPSLAESYQIENEGKQYTVKLKSGVLWHDGKPFTADDVVYTTRILQDPAFKSPLRSTWLGVEVEAKDAQTVVFRLKKEYFGFLETLTLGILPKHIWQNTTSDKFLLSEYNLAPVGTGPYKFKDSEKDANGSMLSVELVANKEYFAGQPFIEMLHFYFYENEESLIAAYNQKQIDGMYNIRPEQRGNIASQKGTTVQSIDFPRTFSIFFNITKSVPLADAKVREALSYAINKEAIVQEVMMGDATAAYGPLLPFMVGYTKDKEPSFNTAKAEEILEGAGWKKNQSGVREKGSEKLAFTLLVPDWPELLVSAELVKTQLGQIGVMVEVAPQPSADLQQGALKNRDYQAILFGQASYLHSDPYSFWHSSQKGEGGLNFSQFENKEADEALDKIRTTFANRGEQDEWYKKFTKIFFNENPSLPLYSPKYLYVQKSTVQGLDTTRINTPAGRLANIKNWYIYTDRVWK